MIYAITIRDNGKAGCPIVRRFKAGEEKQAENFQEEHQRPYDLIVELNTEYEKRLLKRGIEEDE